MSEGEGKRVAPSWIFIYELGESGEYFGETRWSLSTRGSLCHGPTLPAAHSELSPQSEKWARGDGEAVLGEIQGQSTHVSSIYHLPPQAQHITSLLDIITPSEEWGLAEPAEGVFSIYVC